MATNAASLTDRRGGWEVLGSRCWGPEGELGTEHAGTTGHDTVESSNPLVALLVNKAV